MSVNITKGARVNLEKPDGSVLGDIKFCLGWDAIGRPKGNKPARKGFLGSLVGAVEDLVDDVASANPLSSENLDMDSSVYALDANGKLIEKVYFGSKKAFNGAVKLDHDDLTGNSSAGGDDETIDIKLGAIPANVDRLELWINIFSAVSKGQNMSMINNAFARVVDAKTGVEAFRFNLSSEDYKGMLACHVATIYRRNGVWKLNALGIGTMDKSINEIESQYR